MRLTCIRSNIVRTGIQCSYNFQGEVINNTTVGYDSPPTSYGLYFPSLSPTAYVIAKNNITTYAQHVTQNTNLIYNIVYYNQSGLPTSNLVNKPIATIFVGNNATSLEGQYMLSANSPAKGAGEGGVDCGAFGGDEPYIIGGVPSGPIIQELTVPQVTSGSTINVRVKARVQN